MYMDAKQLHAEGRCTVKKEAVKRAILLIFKFFIDQ